MLVFRGTLVFDKIFRLPYLSDIVVVRAHPREELVLPDRLGGCFGKVADKNAVMIGTGTFIHQFLEKRLVGIEELKELDVRGNVEHRLEERERDRNKHGHREGAEETRPEIIDPPRPELAFVEVDPDDGDEADEPGERPGPEHGCSLFTLDHAERGRCAAEKIVHRHERVPVEHDAEENADDEREHKSQVKVQEE